LQLLIYKAGIKPKCSYGIEVWGCAGKVQHSHHEEFPIQNSQHRNNCTLLCNKSYSTYRIQRVSDVIHETINKDHNKPEAHPNPLLEPFLQPINIRRIKGRWHFELKVTSGDIAR